MTSLGLALQQVLPAIHPAETPKTHQRKALYWIRGTARNEKKVRGVDDIVRYVAGSSSPRTRPTPSPGPARG